MPATILRRFQPKSPAADVLNTPGRVPSIVETGRLVRSALRKEFPGATFSVKTYLNTYLDVEWTDGPGQNAVQAIVKQCGGAGFDDGAVSCYRKVTDLERKMQNAGAWIRQNCYIMPGHVPIADKFGTLAVDTLARQMVLNQQQGEDWRTVYNRL